MRGTLHLLPAAELPRYTAALSRLKPRYHQRAWLRAHGLEREQAEAMLAAIRDVLAAGPPLTRRGARPRGGSTWPTGAGTWAAP